MPDNSARRPKPSGYEVHDVRPRHLAWDGLELRLRAGGVLATIEPDGEWPGLWRVRTPDGRLSDMVNLTRAKDAALSLALAALNRPDREAA